MQDSFDFPQRDYIPAQYLTLIPWSVTLWAPIPVALDLARAPVSRRPYLAEPDPSQELEVLGRNSIGVSGAHDLVQDVVTCSGRTVVDRFQPRNRSSDYLVRIVNVLGGEAIKVEELAFTVMNTQPPIESPVDLVELPITKITKKDQSGERQRQQ